MNLHARTTSAATFLLGLAALSWSTPAPSETRDEKEDARPNIIFMMSDDHRAGVLGCEGHPWASSPALDRLAAEGVRFANAFVTTSLCSPARASFLTGMYARRHGVINNGTYLSDKVPSLASSLSAAGYETMYVGKFHMSDQPTRPGFARTASYISQGFYEGTEFLVDGEPVVTEGWVDDVATDFALDFLREEHEAPFLLCLGFKAAHTPPDTPPGLEELYAHATLPPPPNAEHALPFPRRKELRDLMDRDKIGSRAFTTPEDWAADPEARSLDLWQKKLLESAGAERLSEVDNWLFPELLGYYRQIHAIDRNVGRVLDLLDELELADSTIVVYASDNGLMTGEHGMRFKRAAYDSSIRIPLILRYPPLEKPGRVLDELVLNIDLAPTLLDLAGVEAPPAMQGASWRGLLQGEAGASESWRDAFLYEYVREWEYYTPSLYAVRTERWKLVHYPGYLSWMELFDLEADPHETRNLAADPEHEKTLEEMKLLLRRLHAQAGPAPRIVR